MVDPTVLLYEREFIQIKLKTTAIVTLHNDQPTLDQPWSSALFIPYHLRHCEDSELGILGGWLLRFLGKNCTLVTHGFM